MWQKNNGSFFPDVLQVNKTDESKCVNIAFPSREKNALLTCYYFS
jgi:hypothetical protein